MSEATMTTNHGDITFELFDDDAPKTVENFRKLAGDGFYDGLDVPPDHQRLHDPGRLPGGHRHRRPGLHVRGRVQRRTRSSAARWRWPTPARTPTARSSSSSPSTRRRGWTASTPSSARSPTGMDVVDKLEGLPDRRARPPARGRAKIEKPSKFDGWIGHGDRRAATTEAARREIAGREPRHRRGRSAASRSRPRTRCAAMVDARPRGPARLGGARLRGPRARPASAPRSGCSTTRDADRRHDRLRDRQDARGRAAGRGRLRRQRASASGPRTRRSTWPTRRSARSNPFVLGRKLVVRYRPRRRRRRDRAVELPADRTPSATASRRWPPATPSILKPSEVDAADLAADARGRCASAGCPTASSRSPTGARRDRRGADRRGRHGDVHRLDARPAGRSWSAPRRR